MHPNQPLDLSMVPLQITHKHALCYLLNNVHTYVFPSQLFPSAVCPLLCLTIAVVFSSLFIHHYQLTKYKGQNHLDLGLFGHVSFFCLFSSGTHHAKEWQGQGRRTKGHCKCTPHFCLRPPLFHQSDPFHHSSCDSPLYVPLYRLDNHTVNKQKNK